MVPGVAKRAATVPAERMVPAPPERRQIPMNGGTPCRPSAWCRCRLSGRCSVSLERVLSVPLQRTVPARSRSDCPATTPTARPTAQPSASGGWLQPAQRRVTARLQTNARALRLTSPAAGWRKASGRASSPLCNEPRSRCGPKGLEVDPRKRHPAVEFVLPLELEPLAGLLVLASDLPSSRSRAARLGAGSPLEPRRADRPGVGSPLEPLAALRMHRVAKEPYRPR